jgi:hypothetical protein
LRRHEILSEAKVVMMTVQVKVKVKVKVKVHRFAYDEIMGPL